MIIQPKSSQDILDPWVVLNNYQFTSTSAFAMGDNFLKVDTPNVVSNMLSTVWEVQTNGMYIFLNGATYTQIYQGTNISDVSLAFDRNMSYYVTFNEDGQYKLLKDGALTTLSKASYKLAFDNYIQPELGDVIYAYKSGDDIYVENLTTPQSLKFTTIPKLKSINRVGLTTGNRLQLDITVEG